MTMGFRTAEQRRHYLQQRYQKRMQECRNALGNACSQCGHTSDLEFDHIDPLSKSASISRLVANGSKTQLAEELVKCQLLCKSCHLVKTVNKKENVANAKSWIITKKDFTVITCTNLNQWCKDNGYKIHVLMDLARNRRSLQCDIASVVQLQDT
jgi:5-methylcytosine-specific restriction endonuclease McrA